MKKSYLICSGLSALVGAAIGFLAGSKFKKKCQAKKEYKEYYVSDVEVQKPEEKHYIDVEELTRVPGPGAYKVPEILEKTLSKEELKERILSKEELFSSFVEELTKTSEPGLENMHKVSKTKEDEKEESNDFKEPEHIRQEEFENEPDEKKEYLVWFEDDGKLTDEAYNEITVTERYRLLGTEFENWFGKPVGNDNYVDEDDVIYVRNYQNGMVYYIQKDIRPYAEVVELYHLK